MKFFVCNSSGNVGKTTITRELLYSFMAEPKKILEIESVNSSSSNFENIEVEKISDFSNFENIYIKIIETDNLILDVGASLLSNFLDKMGEFAGVETLFDYFIIPTTQGDKVPTDTARTILYLQSIGISNDKIKVIFNSVENISDFDILIKQEPKLNGFKFNTNYQIPKTKLFSELGLLKKTINEIINFDVDSYKNDILQADSKDKLRLVKTDLANRMAVSLYPHLKAIYEELTGCKAIENYKAQAKNTSKKAKADKQAKSNEDGTSENDEEL